MLNFPGLKYPAASNGSVQKLCDLSVYTGSVRIFARTGASDRNLCPDVVCVKAFQDLPRFGIGIESFFEMKTVKTFPTSFSDVL